MMLSARAFTVRRAVSALSWPRLQCRHAHRDRLRARLSRRQGGLLILYRWYTPLV